jgi:L-fuconolactonase
MRQDKFISGIKQLADFNYTYDILIYPHQLKDAIYLVKNCPNNRFVLDHIAKPNIKESKISQWSNYIQKLSEMPNVYCKVSGLVTEANWQNWQKEDFFIYLDTIFNCFGVDRILYGSDWPVCLVAASYESQFEIYTSYFDKLSGAEKDKIFGKNAVKFYSL